MASALRIAWLLAWLVIPDVAAAHVFAPALLELHESDDGRVSVRWKQPLVRTRNSELRPLLPDTCEPSGRAETQQSGTGITTHFEIVCPGGLFGRSIGVDGIAGSGANVLLRIQLADGRTFRRVLDPDAPAYRVPERQGRLDVARSYALLGVEHILGGWDHLLFVLGLVLLVGWGRRLLWTVTAFTIGHSITLALAVLGLVSVPQAPVEAAIAGSIYLLAVELARERQGRPTLMGRGPWFVAGGFGLLHGLGFAGALSAIGLPAGEIPLSLLAFNVGIEAGQLLFVAAVLAVWWALRAVPVGWPAWGSLVPAYGIGSLAVYWLFDRVAGLLGASA